MWFALIGNYLADFDLLFLMLRIMLPRHMVPQPVPRAEFEVAVGTREAEPDDMMALDMVLHMAPHLEGLLTMHALPRPAWLIQLATEGNVGLNQIVQPAGSCNGRGCFVKFLKGCLLIINVWKNLTD